MRTALILLAGLLPITGIAGQESSTRSLVEGPTETATVVVTTIDYRNLSARADPPRPVSGPTCRSPSELSRSSLAATISGCSREAP
jgi:hypothetical protein